MHDLHNLKQCWRINRAWIKISSSAWLFDWLHFTSLVKCSAVFGKSFLKEKKIILFFHFDILSICLFKIYPMLKQLKKKTVARTDMHLKNHPGRDFQGPFSKRAQLLKRCNATLPIRDLRQIAYLLPMWDGIGNDVVFLWRRLICLRNSSLRMLWHRDLNASHFFPHFGVLEHEANRTPDMSATFIASRKKFCKRNRMSVCTGRKRRPSISSLSHRLNGPNRCSRGRITPFQILRQNMVRTWYIHTYIVMEFS